VVVVEEEEDEEEEEEQEQEQVGEEQQEEATAAAAAAAAAGAASASMRTLSEAALRERIRGLGGAAPPQPSAAPALGSLANLLHERLRGWEQLADAEVAALGGGSKAAVAAEAEALAERALAVAPADVGALVAKGEALARRGGGQAKTLAEAEAVFNAAAAAVVKQKGLTPWGSRLFAGLASVMLQQKGRRVEAEAVYRRGIELSTASYAAAAHAEAGKTPLRATTSADLAEALCGLAALLERGFHGEAGVAEAAALYRQAHRVATSGGATSGGGGGGGSHGAVAGQQQQPPRTAAEAAAALAALRGLASVLSDSEEAELQSEGRRARESAKALAALRFGGWDPAAAAAVAAVVPGTPSAAAAAAATAAAKKPTTKKMRMKKEKKKKKRRRNAATKAKKAKKATIKPSVDDAMASEEGEERPGLLWLVTSLLLKAGVGAAGYFVGCFVSGAMFPPKNEAPPRYRYR